MNILLFPQRCRRPACRIRRSAPPLIVAATLAGLWLLCIWSVRPVSAQRFSIDWFKVAAGGGTSSNAQFSLSGTIGQHESGEALSGGNFALTGGFWSLIAAIQTPGAPVLGITVAGPNAVLVSWPAPSTGFVLQETTALNTAAWVDVTNAVTTTAGANQILVPFAGGNKFYRLVFK